MKSFRNPQDYKKKTFRPELKTLKGDKINGFPMVANKYQNSLSPDSTRLFRLAEVHTTVKKLANMLIKLDMIRIDNNVEEVNKYLYWYGLYWYEEVGVRNQFHCASSMETHKARFFYKPKR